MVMKMANKKAKGKRAKTRSILRKKNRQKMTVNRVLAEFSIGEKVAIKAEPSVHSGLPHRRYQGKTGTVTGKRGKCFEVKTMKGNKEAILIVHPTHLQRIGGQK